MLKPAQLYKDQLLKEYVKTWYKPENIYYTGWTGDSVPEIPDNNSEKSCDMPRYIANVYDNLEIVASKQGFELLGIRDKATGKVYVKERRSIDV